MNALQRALQPLQRRAMLMIGRCVLELLNTDTKMQSAQVSLLDDELRDKVEHFQMFGFTSAPEAGAEGVALSVAGNRDHVIVVCVDDRRYRKLGLLPGEVCVYSKWGDFIHLKEDQIEVKHSTRVLIDSPLVETTNDLRVGGTIHSVGNITSDENILDQGGTKSMAGMRAVYNAHDHANPEGGRVASDQVDM